MFLTEGSFSRICLSRNLTKKSWRQGKERQIDAAVMYLHVTVATDPVTGSMTTGSQELSGDYLYIIRNANSVIRIMTCVTSSPQAI